MNKWPGYIAVFGCGFACCALLARVPVANGLLGRGSGLPSLSGAVARVEPAVVNIDVTGGANDREPSLSGSGAFEGAGSGVLFSSDGYIVTNNHVVEPAAVAGGRGTLSVRLDSGRTFDKVKIVGRDPQTDLAVLKLEGARNLPTATWGDSDTLRIGDWAIAVGNPLGFNSSVSLGIVSALHRRGLRPGGEPIERVIQTDAAINPGSSGGALADDAGRVIGINTAIASSTGATVGIGFAIPINQARPIIEALIRDGRVIRPYLGVVYVPLLSLEPRALPPGVTLPTDYGAVLYSENDTPAVVPGSPAAKAGLKPFDVLREIDGVKIGDTREVRALIQNKRVGDTLTLLVWRAGKTRTVTVVLAPLPAEFSTAKAAPSTNPRAAPGRMPDLYPEN